MKTNPDDLANELATWKASLISSFDIGGLFSRNPTAHKWKAPFRALLIRECVFWRLHDLLDQSFILHQQGKALGARILLRSGFETLATLIYLNQIMGRVLDGTYDFHAFGHKTAVLLLGSRNHMTEHTAMNIKSVLEHCAKRYEWIAELYADLSESAHPNHEGLCLGYTRPDRENFIETFANRWSDLYAANHCHGIALCMDMFENEYNVVWFERMPALEKWIEANDAELEATSSGIT